MLPPIDIPGWPFTAIIDLDTGEVKMMDSDLFISTDTIVAVVEALDG